MSVKKPSRKTRRPSTTPEGRENQLVSLAFDLAEKQLIEGSAPAQVLTHFLKLGTAREKLEQERLQKENLLISAKVDQISNAIRMDELFEKAINAMRQYAGRGSEEYDEE